MSAFMKIGGMTFVVFFLFIFNVGQTKENFDKKDLVKKAKEVEKIQLLLHNEMESFESIYEKFSPYLTDQFLQAYVNENAYLVEGLYRWKEMKSLTIPRVGEKDVQFYQDKKNQIVYMCEKISINRYTIIMYQFEKNSWKISGVMTNTQLPLEIKAQKESEGSFWNRLTKNLKGIRLFQ